MKTPFPFKTEKQEQNQAPDSAPHSPSLNSKLHQKWTAKMVDTAEGRKWQLTGEIV